MEAEKVASENLLEYIYVYTVNFTWWKNNWDGELACLFAGKLNFFAQGVY